MVFIFSNLIVSIDEWRKQLAAYLIDYDSLDIKETIASGLWMSYYLNIKILYAPWTVLVVHNKDLLEILKTTWKIYLKTLF